MSHYEKALELDPNNLLAQNFLGVIYYELKEFEKAEEAFNRTLTLDPSFADAYGNLGILYDFNLHDKRKAVQYYEKFLELKKEGENVSVIQELLNKSKTELARIEHAEEGIKIKQESPAQSLSVLEEGKMLFAQSKYEEAKSKFQAHLSQKPDDIDAKIYWAITVSKTEPNQKAIPILKEVIQKAKNSSDLWYELAYAYDKEGSSEALHAFEEAVRLAPKDIRASAARERIEALKLKSFAPSQVTLPSVNSNHVKPLIKPPEPVPVNTEKAKSPVKEPIKEVPPISPKKVTQASKAQSINHFNQAVSLQAKGHHQNAIAEYEKALQLNPYNFKAHYNLGILYKGRGDYARAAREYSEAIKLDPNFSKAYYNLGVILEAQGRREEAISKFKKAVLLDPRYSDAYLGLGLLHSQSKREIHQAVFYYKKYLALNPTGATATKVRSWLRSIGENG
jgi:tetratricopeptide (TPR) repeat protein